MIFKNKIKIRFGIFLSVFILIGVIIIPSAFSIKTIINRTENSNYLFDGYVLYTPEYSRDTYMINKEGEIVHTWVSNNIQALVFIF
jgi:hypothetical protein